MQRLTVTVDIDGDRITREFDAEMVDSILWEEVIRDMVQTLADDKKMPF